VIDGSLKRHNHLPDVNELRGALSDSVDAQKLAGILMEKKFSTSPLCEVCSGRRSNRKRLPVAFAGIYFD
jgi:hypothetical protein